MLSELRTADFHYDLPPELIAQHPAAERDRSRLLVLHRAENRIEHRQFPDLLEFLRPEDVLVLNDTRVIPARLRGRNSETGGRFELLLLEESGVNDWWAMLKPGKRAPVGRRIELLTPAGQDAGLAAIVEDIAEDGRRRLRFSGVENIVTELDRLGETPLPPYIHREAGARAEAEDRERYQTVYARAHGSVAAPTAGLHFTEKLLARIRERGVTTCFVTLHVSAGTFAPVKTEWVAEHQMHPERYHISAETISALQQARARGGRIIAAGTTTLRTLESAGKDGLNALAPGPGTTNIFIYPPRKFNIVDALLTNFHLPCSTLLMLVSAFASPGEMNGREMILSACREAVAQRYRFFSYGDAMLIQ